MRRCEKHCSEYVCRSGLAAFSPSALSGPQGSSGRRRIPAKTHLVVTHTNECTRTHRHTHTHTHNRTPRHTHTHTHTHKHTHTHTHTHRHKPTDKHTKPSAL